jgi:lysozyme
MNVSPKGIALIKRWEGFRARPYLCPAGVPTIGYGSTMWPSGRKVSLSDKPITQFTASALVEAECHLICCKLKDLVKVELKQGMVDALCSFIYNPGIGAFARSTLLVKLNAGDFIGAGKEIVKWDKARIDGELRSLKGLRERRRAEYNMFFS